jgi:hypothetical protein
MIPGTTTTAFRERGAGPTPPQISGWRASEEMR